MLALCWRTGRRAQLGAAVEGRRGRPGLGAAQRGCGQGRQRLRSTIVDRGAAAAPANGPAANESQPLPGGWSLFLLRQEK